jgi:hypothetical protein
MRIDLHTHTTCSDGTDSPAALVSSAAAAGLDAIAVTDHDTTAGWDEAVAAGLAHGVEVILGIELSCVDTTGTGVHMLAYGVDPDHPELAAALGRLRQGRSGRLPQLLAQLDDLGIHLTVDDIARHQGDAAFSLPHLAMALVEYGHAPSIRDAFVTWLDPGAALHVPFTRLPVREGVGLLARAGGVVVLAHPCRRDGENAAALIEDLIEHGLAGVEVDHPDHDGPTRSRLRDHAGRLGLLTTGASDYHGGNKTIRLGADLTDPEHFAQLRALMTTN